MPPRAARLNKHAKRESRLIREESYRHMERLVDHRPSFTMSILKRGQMSPSWIRRSNVFPTMLGREAIMLGILVLLRHGLRKILVPAYLPSSVLRPIIESGVEFEFYEVREDLQVNFERLEERIDRGADAILVIHYEGYPQPIEQLARLCRAKGVRLVEDCAAVLPGSSNLGAVGDMAIFSLRKPLPLPDGGLLMVNRRDLLHHAEDEYRPVTAGTPRYMTTISGAGMLLMRGACASHESLVLNTLYLGLSRAFPQPFLYRRTSLHPMSGFSRQMLAKMDLREVTKRRAENCRFYLDECPFPAIFPSVSDESALLTFPVRVGRMRNRLARLLKRRGIIATVHWRLPRIINAKEFPASWSTSRSVLNLPVNQDLTMTELERVVHALKEAHREIRYRSDRCLPK